MMEWHDKCYPVRQLGWHHINGQRRLGVELYAVTDGVRRQEFSRGTEAAAFAQARGLLVMIPAIRSETAELQVWRSDTWTSLGRVGQLPEQAPYRNAAETVRNAETPVSVFVA